MEWFIKANVNLALWYFVFRWVLQFSSNRIAARIFLLIIPMLACLLPILEIPNTVEQMVSVTLPEVDVTQVGSSITEFDWKTYVGAVYFFGVFVSLIISFGSLVKLQSHKSKGTAFSFFSYIYIPTTPSETYKLMQLHELAHVKYWHSVDIVYYTLFRALFWFNPVSYLLFKLLKQEHEFEADAYVIKQTQQLEDYCDLLVDETFGVASSQAMKHSFHSSYSLLNRINMITKTQPQSVSLWKKIATVPAICLALFISVAQPEVAAQGIDGKVYSGQDAPSQMPEFVGGKENLVKFLSNEIKYPTKCRDQKIEGRVVLKFVVDKNGRIRNVQNVKKDVDALLVNEAIRVVKGMPKWNPGKNNGEDINTEMVLPIVFKL